MSGLNIKKLKPGTVVEVKTAYSTYILQITERVGYVMIQGGKHIKSLCKAYISGSVKGGILYGNWLGKNMRMEIQLKDMQILTSAIKGIKISGLGWEYDLDLNQSCHA